MTLRPIRAGGDERPVGLPGGTAVPAVPRPARRSRAGACAGIRGQLCPVLRERHGDSPCAIATFNGEKDPNDDKYVAAALAAAAEYVVTLDRRHLLSIGSFQGVRFVTPGDFLAVLRSSGS